MLVNITANAQDRPLLMHVHDITSFAAPPLPPSKPNPEGDMCTNSPPRVHNMGDLHNIGASINQLSGLISWPVIYIYHNDEFVLPRIISAEYSTLLHV